MSDIGSRISDTKKQTCRQHHPNINDVDDMNHIDRDDDEYTINNTSDLQGEDELVCVDHDVSQEPDGSSQVGITQLSIPELTKCCVVTKTAGGSTLQGALL